MKNDDITFFIQASSKRHGPLAIFYVYGKESVLCTFVDAAIGLLKKSIPSNALELKELRYGWLRSCEGDVIDEVMVAKPIEGMRVLMTHGGSAIAYSVSSYLTQTGFPDATERLRKGLGGETIVKLDPLLDTLLASCQTEAQAAAVLAFREKDGGDAGLSIELLTTHRVLLAGPPNVGKSSLLNHLSGFERAFVHDEAGATRDVVDELVDLGGFAVMLGDLPGYSEREDCIGVAVRKKAEERLAMAEAVFFVCDAGAGWNAATDAAAGWVADILGHIAGSEHRRVLVVLNKADLPDAVVGQPWERHFPGARSVRVCALPNGNAKSVLGGEAWSLLVR